MISRLALANLIRPISETKYKQKGWQHGSRSRSLGQVKGPGLNSHYYWAWWYISIILTTWEAGTRGSWFNAAWSKKKIFF
jgi:hypothetical protein